MSNRADIDRFYDVYEKGNRYPKVGLAYTCNCGWVDAGHANPSSSKPNIGAANLWKDILTESEKHVQNGFEGFRIKYLQDASAWGITFKNNGDYFVKTGLSEYEKKKVALAVFQEVSLGFEKIQGMGVKGFLSETFGTGSSFSQEDLVSNLLSFYDAVEKIHWQDRCGIVSRKASMSVWDNNGAIGAQQNKNYGFIPKYERCNECPGNPVFPDAYQRIYPISKGIWRYDFNPNASPLVSNGLQIPFRGNLFSGDYLPGFGYRTIPKEVVLRVNENESQYFFARRALMHAAFVMKMSLLEQLDFADQFYPLNKNLKEISEFKIQWLQGDPSNDKDKNVKDAEFDKIRGKTFTLTLSPKQYEALKRKVESKMFVFSNNFF